MVLKIGGEYHCYYCGSTDEHTRCVVAHGTSRDLTAWSDYRIVCAGGSAGSGPYSAERPFVVYHDGHYYLLWTSTHVPPITHVCRSGGPADLGVDADARKIRGVPLAYATPKTSR